MSETSSVGFKSTVVYKLLKILGIAWLHFRKDHCLVRASGLAFTSFIALVPFVALTFSFLSLFGAFEPLIGNARQFLFDILVPTKQQATLVFRGTHYTGRFLSRLSIYVTVPLFVALILGVTVSLVGWVQPLLSRIRVDDVEILSGFVIAVLPIFMIWLYIVWGVFLYALEITYVHQYGTYSWAGQISLEMPPKDRLLMGLKVFFYIAEAKEEKRKPPDNGAVLRKYYSGG